MRASHSGGGLELIATGEWTPIVVIDRPVTVEIWSRESASDAVERYRLTYDSLVQHDDALEGTASVQGGSASVHIRDRWQRTSADTWQIERYVSSNASGPSVGVRVGLEVTTLFDAAECHLFAPPTMYDRNDLDGDGIDDYLGTMALSYREDRLNSLSVMAYHAGQQVAVSLIRADTPAFDDRPHRPNRERQFLQQTDIGSLGWRPSEDGRLVLQAYYPFNEGERSHALLLIERPGWGAYWPVSPRAFFSMSYRVRLETAPSFLDALWRHFARRLNELRPVAVPLQASASALLRYRAECLKRYYFEAANSHEAPRPAGYVMNCHPQDGTQLADIIQYGFTGQNILCAYLMLRYGRLINDTQTMEEARRVIDFYVHAAHLPDVGMFWDLYNVPKQTFDCWWTGLLLPLAYAEPGAGLERLMGPLYQRWADEIAELKRVRGSYLRCMAESVYALLLAFSEECRQGRVHADWLASAVRFGEFLVRTQEADGSWYRAYDHQAHPLTAPAIWFGTNDYEKKSSTATAVMPLLALYDAVRDARYLDSAKRAGTFVREHLVKPIRFNGGIHDPIYAKGQLIDNEGILYPMVALLMLYERTGNEYFLHGAAEAARLFATWICLWDVPLPPDSTLARHGFRSTGAGACDTCGAGYVHSFELLAVPELIKIAKLCRDPDLFRVADLHYHWGNQTVQLPDRDWGYKFPGMQEEGYFISWWLLDDPIFHETAFGRRWKGEGNKTCFPWLAAVAMACHWRLQDWFGTISPTEIADGLVPSG